MSISWVLYSVATALLLACAAAVAEWSLLLMKRPTRWIWLMALLMSVSLPGLALFADAPVPKIVGGGITPAIQVAGTTADLATLPRFSDSRSLTFASWQARLDAPVRTVCYTLSVLFASLLLTSAFRLREQSKRWIPDTVSGASVLISENVGPAVSGLFHPVVVLPRWARDLDEPTQRIMVAHEQAHLRAGDPWLLAAALGGLILMPWNLPLWWTVRRLRHAIELDCDARVLSGGVDGRSYGRLLLTVSQGPAPDYSLVTPLLGEPLSYLERRVRIMTRRMPKHAKSLAAGAIAASALVLSGALLLPRPDLAHSPTTEKGKTPPTAAASWQVMAGGTRITGQESAQDSITEAQVHAVLAERHPDLLRGSTQDVSVYIVATRQGVVQRSLAVPTSRTKRAITTVGSTGSTGHSISERITEFDSTNAGELPRAQVVRGRDVVGEIKAELGAGQVHSVRMWNSQAVPGGVSISWITLER